MLSNIMYIAAMRNNKDDQNEEDHNKDNYNKDYHNETCNQLIEHQHFIWL